MLEFHPVEGDDFVRLWVRGHLEPKQTAQDLSRALDDAGGAPDRVLVQLSDLEGWEPAANWEALSDDERRPGVRKLALVGPEERREDLLAAWAALMPQAQARYYDLGEADQASAWLRS